MARFWLWVESRRNDLHERRCKTITCEFLDDGKKHVKNSSLNSANGFSENYESFYVWFHAQRGRVQRVSVERSNWSPQRSNHTAHWITIFWQELNSKNFPDKIITQNSKVFMGSKEKSPRISRNLVILVSQSGMAFLALYFGFVFLIIGAFKEILSTLRVS